MKHIYDAKLGEADKSGKTHWKTVGKIFEKDNGQKSLMIDLGINGKVWAQLYEPSQEEPNQPFSRKKSSSFDDDEIPFN